MKSTTAAGGDRPGIPWRSFRWLNLLAALALCGGAPPGSAAPAQLAPPAPFPAIVSQDVETEPVAPGVRRSTYRLLTTDGPIVASVVEVDPREPTVRLGTVLANDRIVSKDEPVSAMARRTGAVAGINGDYFDIAGSGAPVGVLVRDGALLRSPSTRAALTVTRDRGLRFETYRFAGSVTSGPVTVPITAINVWPPEGGASLLTDAFGPIPSQASDVTLLDLVPSGNAVAAAKQYRVAAAQTGPPWPTVARVRIAYGAAARAFGRVPDVGDIVTVTYDTDPPLANVAAAIGGGPLLLQNGTPVNDPASPNYSDRERRIPAAAAALLANGTLALIVVDGRHGATSIGVNRAELIALLRGLGATDALLFDSGGSATLVARVLGEADARVVNEPSDGVERPVADGLYVYSDAPLGPPHALVVRPARVVALPGAAVPLRALIVDTNLHGLGAARGPWRISPSPLVDGIDARDVLHVAQHVGAGTVALERGGVGGSLRIEAIDRVARIAIGPDRVNPDAHAVVTLSAHAFDARNRPVAVDGLVTWSARDGIIDRLGRLTAGDRDATVTASAGGVRVSTIVPVGRHDVPLALFDEAHRAAWQLSTVPASANGASLSVAGGALRITYDLGAGTRAVNATVNAPLGAPLALSCAIDGDGSGGALRATLADRYGDRQTIALSRGPDFSDTRRAVAAVPAALAPPLVLRNLSVIVPPASSGIGSVAVHDCTASVAGSGVPSPQVR